MYRISERTEKRRYTEYRRVSDFRDVLKIRELPKFGKCQERKERKGFSGNVVR